ncbi:hypothetical protein EJV47_25570 [Hymenobacter gummosus]|uniref:T9SS type A sorting domain-containing protein n=1 Tax=Hymenobacter gummosus TaxID=1776032 RepID=A0A431TVH8_9BACT|nr:SBBP repeat-containing protein [Hymenobacter gummosus]RTQ45250.1 hypothetical protein EJV47_25570 [Hymenobacter gummosus]
MQQRVLFPGFLLACLWLVLACRTPAGAQSWDQSLRLGSGDNGTVVSQFVKTDNAGNTYIAGYFGGQVSFGSTTLVSVGSDDLFVAKLDAAGQWLWARRAGGSDQARARALVLDGGGNVYLAGYFAGTAANFGPATLASAGGNDVFVAKLSTGGSWQWAQRAGGSTADDAAALAVDAAGSAYVDGTFSGGAADFGATSLASAGNTDVFVARLSSSGGWSWAVRAGGGGAEQATGLSLDAAGNAYWSGLFSSASAAFGATTLTNPSSSGSSSDVFVAKVSAAGAWNWALRAGNGNSEQLLTQAVDGAGNVYITGNFLGTAAAFGATSLNSAGNYDLFVAKISAAGSWSWALRAGGSNSEQVGSLALDANGNVYLGGNFTSTSAAFGSTTLTKSGTGFELFLARVSAAGSWSWALRANSSTSSYKQVEALVTDGAGDAYMVGYFSGNNIGFGTVSLAGSPDGGYSSYMVKATAAGAWVWGQQIADNGTHIPAMTAALSGSNLVLTGIFQNTRPQFGTNTLLSGERDASYVAALSTAAGAWQWSLSPSGGSGSKTVTQTALDAAGNRYMYGTFFGNLTLGSTTLTSTGGADLFVAKLDVAGNVLWARHAGSAQYDYATALAVDEAGNAYVTGHYGARSISFGSTTFVTPSGRGQGMFVAKLDAAGNWVWGQVAYSEEVIQTVGLAVDAAGNCYVTGDVFAFWVEFGGNRINCPQDAYNAFVARLDASGSWSWAYVMGDYNDDRGGTVAVDGSGNAYISGTFIGAVSFGATTLNSTTGGTFAAKLDAAGNWLWARNASLGNPKLAVDAAGNALLAGRFAGTASFGTTALSSAGGLDVAVARLDANGNWTWASRAGGPADEHPTALLQAADGAAYLTGTFLSTAAEFGSTTLPNAGTGTTDGFVAKLDAAGNWLWGQRAGGSGSDALTVISLDGQGRTYVAGNFSSSALTLGATFAAALTNADASDGSSDVVVARLDAATGGWQGRVGGGGIGNDYVVGLSVDAADRLSVAVVARSANAAFGSLVLSGGSSTYAQSVVGRISPASLLPVELLHFAAAAAGPAAVQLNWTTAQELNNAGFTVERSPDGRRFTAVGAVAGAGTSTARRSYSLRDEHLPAGAVVLYYRLVQRDLDGSTTTSEVRTVALRPDGPGFRVYPSILPAGQTLHYAGAPAPGGALELVSLLGQRVARCQLPAGGQGHISLAGLRPGWYLARLAGQGGPGQRVLVQP